MLRTHLRAVGFTFAIAAGFASVETHAVQRTFVASFGADTNTASNCSLAAPCRGFAAAQTVTDNNGEIIALDSAGYGAVTITKSIAIIAPTGVHAGISVFPGTNGVNITTPGVNVVLRGLSINGQGGDNGINMTAGASLSVENCVITNFSNGFQVGIFVNAAAIVSIVNTLVRDTFFGIQIRGGAVAEISRVNVVRASTIGIFVGTTTANILTSAAISDTTVFGRNQSGSCLVASTEATGASTRVSIIRSVLNQCTGGILSNNFGAGSTVVTVSDTAVTASDTGLGQNGAGATIRSLGNNTLDQNGNDTSGTITAVTLK